MAVSSLNIQDAYQKTARTKFRSEITNHQPQRSAEVFRHGQAWRARKQETITASRIMTDSFTFHYTRKLENNEIWVGHVTRMGRGEAYTGFWGGNLKERDHLEDPGVDGKKILRWIFRK